MTSGGHQTKLLDTTDFIILGAVAVLSGLYFFYFRNNASNRTTMGGSGSAATGSGPAGSVKYGSADSRNSSTASLGRKSILEKLRKLDNATQLALFYGSQTGTAEDLATRLAKEITTAYGVPAITLDPEEYDMTELASWPTADLEAEGKKWLCGFFMATYGEGEPTDNAVEFYDWIMSGKGKGDDDGEEEDGDFDELLENASLEDFKYIIFGLGNRTYEHYNAIGRRLDKRLRKIGAKRIGERGEGDDDSSLEEDFLAWKPKILAAMAEYFGVEAASAGAQREKRHVPLFDMAEITDGSDMGVYWGEHSVEKPRRWKLQQAGEEDYEIVDHGSGEKYVEVSAGVPHDAKHPHYGRIIQSKPLFVDVQDEYTFEPKFRLPKAGHKRYLVEGTKVRIERHCLQVDLDLNGSGLKYESGDHVGVWPVNDEEHVEKLAKVLRLGNAELDKVITLKPNKENKSAESAKLPFPLPCTIRTALLHYLDLPAIVKQYQLEVLAKYAQDTAERDTLFELADNRELFVSLIEKGRKDLSDVLEDFPSVRVPVSVVIGELLPRIAVRYYSISSSSKEQPNSVGITAVMVRYALPASHPTHRIQNGEQGAVVVKQGLATSWLQRLHEMRVDTIPDSTSERQASAEPIPVPKFHLPLYIRTSNFKLPRNPRLPVVMVGPGTGVAPFRAFVRERFHLARTAPQMKIGPTWLFYGCRHPDKDFLYREEFEQMEKDVQDGKVELDLKIFKAFSRVPGQKKMYVQHLFMEQGEQVWKMLGVEGGYFYICGDAKHMAADVQVALTKIALEHGKMSNEEAAKAWVKDLKTKGRYLEDVWA